MTQSDYPVTCLLLTGSELMSGDTIDTNSAFLAQALQEIGIGIQQKITIGDQLALLVNSINHLTHQCQLLIINGGLGPTQDDLTAEAMAKAANTPISTHEQARQHILNWCKDKRISINNANLKQAELPCNATIFPDAPGSAPAFYLTINNCLVIATPGVPSELKHITHQHLLPFIQHKFGNLSLEPWKKIQLLGIGESRLQELINTQLFSITKMFDIGFRVNFPLLELKYKPWSHIKTSDSAFLNAEQLLLQQIEEFIICTGDKTIEELLVTQLCENQKTISCAESCTGGLIASRITRIAGASAIFPGSIVSYSNTIKHQLLNVSTNTLNNHGAVSKATVREMLKGILDTMQTDYGIAVSGIAGPSGGNTEKPAGTVCIAWGSQQQSLCVELLIPLPRTAFQEMVAAISMDLARRFDKGEKNIPAYLQRWQPNKH